MTTGFRGSGIWACFQYHQTKTTSVTVRFWALLAFFNFAPSGSVPFRVWRVEFLSSLLRYHFDFCARVWGIVLLWASGCFFLWWIALWRYLLFTCRSPVYSRFPLPWCPLLGYVPLCCHIVLLCQQTFQWTLLPFEFCCFISCFSAFPCFYLDSVSSCGVCVLAYCFLFLQVFFFPSRVVLTSDLACRIS